MCGRYVRKGSKQKIAEYFRASPNPAELPMPDADYNIAPTTYQPIIRQSRETSEREMVLARWGWCRSSRRPEGREGTFNDQRTGGDDHRVSNLAGAVQEAQVPCSCRRVYRVAKRRKAAKAAIYLRAGEREALCFCGPLGCMERQGRSLVAVLRHRDHRGQRIDEPDTSAYAGNPSLA